MMKLILLFLSAVLTSAVMADDVVREQGNGSINWTKGMIYAHGYGVAPSDAPDRKQRLLARRAAQVDAYRNLAEIMQGVRVTSETVVQDMVLASDVVQGKVNALVKGAIMTKDHYQNKVAHVTMEVKMEGDFSSAVNQPKLFNSASLEQKVLDTMSQVLAGVHNLLAPTPAFAATPLITTPSDYNFARNLLSTAEEIGQKQAFQNLMNEMKRFGDNAQFSGLLVDASNVTQFELATIPRIRNSDGEVLYPKEELFEQELVAKRPVSYDFDLIDAISNHRVATNPMIIKAENIYKARNSDLVISNEDAALITGNKDLMSIIKSGGVVIVVEP